MICKHLLILRWGPDRWQGINLSFMVKTGIELDWVVYWNSMHIRIIVFAGLDFSWWWR